MGTATNPMHRAQNLIDGVKSKADERKRVEQEFRYIVRRANENGFSVREIAEAAGYKSHSSIQKILDKHT